MMGKALNSEIKVVNKPKYDIMVVVLFFFFKL